MPDSESKPKLPTEVSEEIGFFDRFAGKASDIAGRAPFFAGCLMLVILWLAQGLVVILVTGKPSKFLDAQFQLEINTTTTIITFLMVALLQNSQTRNDQAVHHKLNAIADGLSDLMSQIEGDLPDRDLKKDMAELRAAVGLEEHESTSDNAAEASARS
jgi:low affinity Fe/Cu permease